MAGSPRRSTLAYDELVAQGSSIGVRASGTLQLLFGERTPISAAAAMIISLLQSRPAPHSPRRRQHPYGWRFRPLRRSPWDAGPCLGGRSSTRSRPGAAVWRMPYCVRETRRDALKICKHAIAPFLVQPGKRGRKEMIRDRRANSPFVLCSRIGFPRSKELPCPSDPAPSPIRPCEGGGRSPGGKGPAAGEPRRRGSAGRQALGSVFCFR